MNEVVDAPFSIPSSLRDQLARLKELFQVATVADGLGRRIWERIHRERDGLGFESDLHLVSYFLFAKGFRTYQSTLVLCLSGQGVDAVSLCGGLFETIVDLRYIREEPGSRPRRFIEFERVEPLLRVQRILSMKGLPEDSCVSYEKLGEDAAGPQHSFNRSISKGWSERTLRERSDEVGMGLEYEERYGIICAYKHNSRAGASLMVLSEPCGVLISPHIAGVFTAALNGTEFFLRLCGHFQDIYQLGMSAEINGLEVKLQDVAQSLRSAAPDLCDCE